MSPRRRNTWKRILSLSTVPVTLAGMLILSGCGTNDPASPGASTDASWIGDMHQDDVALGKGGHGNGNGGSGRVASQAPVHAQQLVNPGLGGEIDTGRYTLIVPPGALPSAALYTVDYKNAGIIEVELGPHGAQFNAPVTLRIDLTGTTASPNDDITLYWWDEDSFSWVDVGGTWDPATMTLTTQLDHFCTFRPGRAGW
ncbi:MAG: hypothetical protein R3E12_02000 [Candidatus Eisenbacteria bacterium]